ncbi:MAG: glycosyltransferase [Desulfobacterales bacterium]
MQPEISICIPTFNRKEYLKETLSSIFAQTYSDYEIVIVDDGSTDGTEQMLKESCYEVRYHWQENRGDATARNKLIELAQGRYITFIDSDDLLISDAVERMVEVVKREPDDVVVYGNYISIDEYGNEVKRSKRKLYSGYITQHLFRNILIHSCGSMFPKRILVRTGGFDSNLRVCSDYDLWLRLSLKYRFIALSEPTFKRRRHSGNLSAISYKNILTELKVLERFYYENGGKEAVPENIAMARLAREGYRVAKYAMHERSFQQALDLLLQSLRRHFQFKAACLYAYIYTRKLFNGK